jgi:hypothetical protein
MKSSPNGTGRTWNCTSCDTILDPWDIRIIMDESAVCRGCGPETGDEVQAAIARARECVVWMNELFDTALVDLSKLNALGAGNRFGIVLIARIGAGWTLTDQGQRALQFMHSDER